MLTHSNNSYDSTLNALQKRAGSHVTQAVHKASARTGVDFAYLMENAAAESSFNPAASARGSSAKGLYQFIDSTWLETMRDHGAKHGLGEYAAAIDHNGRVASRAMRREILALRNDPGIAALMAGEFTADNHAQLQNNLGSGRAIAPTDLYLAHFMGAGGATSFIKAMDESPARPAADLFPREARANPGVFYNRETGKPLSLASIYDRFENKFSGTDKVADARGDAADRAGGFALTDTQRRHIIKQRGDLTMVQQAGGADSAASPVRMRDISWNGPRRTLKILDASSVTQTAAAAKTAPRASAYLRPETKPDEVTAATISATASRGITDLAAFEHQNRAATQSELLVLTQMMNLR